MVPDLTEEHVYADKINKMCVKLMMQVFSKNLSSFIDLLSRSPGKIYQQFNMLVHLLRERFSIVKIIILLAGPWKTIVQLAK